MKKIFGIIVLFCFIFFSLGCTELNPFDSWIGLFEKKQGLEVELEGIFSENGRYPVSIYKEEEMQGYLWKDNEKSVGVSLILEKKIECEGKKTRIKGEIVRREVRAISGTLDTIEWALIKVNSYECV